jgi:hypothetical protein
MFALKLDVRACTRLLSVAAAARLSPLLLPGARCCCCTQLRCCCCTALCCSAAAPLLSCRGGRLRAAALVGDQYAVRFLGAAACEAAAAFESLQVLLATWIFAPPQAGEKDERRFEKRNLCSRVPRLRFHVAVFWSHAKSRAVLGGTLGENAAWCSGHGSSAQEDGCGLSPAAGPAWHVVLCGHRSVFSSPPGRRMFASSHFFHEPSQASTHTQTCTAGTHRVDQPPTCPPAHRSRMRARPRVGPLQRTPPTRDARH